MTTNQNHFKNNELEQLTLCTVCGKDSNFIRVREDVKDWTFGCVGGNWSYDECKNCQSLVLNPRPKQNYISLAYQSYYTHSDSSDSRLMQKLENEIIYHWFKTSIGDRFNSRFSFLFKGLKSILYYKFPLNQFDSAVCGNMLDIGCGNGKVMQILQNNGWDVKGVEFDNEAAQLAQSNGLQVKVGSYEVAKEFNELFDFVIASHVIEHIYNPKELIDIMLNLLKVNGKALIVYPNPESFWHKIFKEKWRGLEAPRHISLPSKNWLISYIKSLGDYKVEFYKSNSITFWGSYKIMFQRESTVEGIFAKLIQCFPAWIIPFKMTDAIQISIQRKK